MSLNVLSTLVRSRNVHGLNEPSANCLYELPINGLYILSINFHTCDLRVKYYLSANGLYGLSVNGLYVISINIRPPGT